VHVVQIWIMHINALKTQLMHKNVQTNPEKSQKLTQHSYCSMLTREKNLKAIRGNGYRFSPKGGTFPTETIMLVVRSSGLWEAYTQTCPKWDKKITTACWCRSMIACQVSWIWDKFWIYENLRTRYLNVCGQVTVVGCLTFIPISCMGPKHATKDTYLNFQLIYMH
jgi:hypothetical protein